MWCGVCGPSLSCAGPYFACHVCARTFLQLRLERHRSGPLRSREILPGRRMGGGSSVHLPLGFVSELFAYEHSLASNRLRMQRRRMRLTAQSFTPRSTCGLCLIDLRIALEPNTDGTCPGLTRIQFWVQETDLGEVLVPYSGAKVLVSEPPPTVLSALSLRRRFWELFRRYIGKCLLYGYWVPELMARTPVQLELGSRPFEGPNQLAQVREFQERA